MSRIPLSSPSEANPVHSSADPRGAKGSAAISGVLVVDKPEGMTSFAVVAKVRRLLHLKKAGHCGTLDPFATGVLLVCANQATRIVDQLLTQDKLYRFTVVFGVETDTLDRTGQVVRTFEGPARELKELENALEAFRGTYTQEVPRYAAVKVDGRRLYELSRSGIEVDLPSREVHIHSLELLTYNWPRAELQAHCGKGTYIRQLTADIGRIMGCGAHVSELRRLASGPFRVERAVSLEELEEGKENNRWLEKLLSINEALVHLPAVVVEDEGMVRRLHNGCLDPAWEGHYRAHFPDRTEPVRLLTRQERLIALWWPQPQAAQGRRLRVLV